MKKFKQALFWILSDALIILGIVFLPSVFSIFCFITAIILFPIEEWQSLLKKSINKHIRAIIIAICVAVVIAEFPLSVIITRIHKLVNLPPPSSDFKVYYEESPSSQNPSVTSNITSSVSSTQKADNVSSVASKPQKENSSKASTTSTTKNPELVYRTPSGKRYHLSANCGGINSYEISLEEAQNEDLTPCQKCASDLF